ncbi:MAG: hypothetical protein V3V18_09805 [Methylococcales bacterium]
MKAIIFLMVFISSLVSAHPRVDIPDGYCTFVASESDATNEIYLSNCNARVTLKDGQAEAIVYTRRRASIPLELNSNDLGEACEIRDGGGNTYLSDNWRQGRLERRGYNFLICKEGVRQ